MEINQYLGMFVGCDFHVSKVNMSECSEQILHTDCNDDVAQEEGKVDTSVLALPQNPTMPAVLEDVKVENPDGPLCSIGDGANSFSGADVPGFKSDQLDDDDDYLDHIILKERQRMILLSRCSFVVHDLYSRFHDLNYKTVLSIHALFSAFFSFKIHVLLHLPKWGLIFLPCN